ncbi:MAG TPA: hypothetical protein VMD91_04545 [Candidatus Sulfotelmatobacter sp.]|nr:hypothetical protein [Candidatus Sulfotelmatobacter sp.]
MSARTLRYVPRHPLACSMAVIVAIGCTFSLTTARASTSPAPDGTAIDADRVVALVTAGSGQLDSYIVPLHIDARVRKLFTFHVKLDGTVYFKRPERVKLEMGLVPAQYRHLFAALGSPLTWSQRFDFSTESVTMDGARKMYHLRGTPRTTDPQIASVALDVPEEHLGAMHVRWTCVDGTAIDEHVYPGNDGTYDLPKRAEIEMTAQGFHVDADLLYGDYALNEGFPDSVFTGGS